MTTRLTMTLAPLLLTAVCAPAPAQLPAAGQPDPLAAYLAPDGRLRAPLEVRDEKKGFGVFAGMVYRVEPDGRWTVTEIVRRQPYLRGQGQLPREDLKKLAQALARYDLLSLPNVGRPNVNPHVLTIVFGGRAVELTFGVDQVAVAPDPADPTPDLVGRYGGISGAVRGLLQAPGLPGIRAGTP
jgi:hypothetical protein